MLSFFYKNTIFQNQYYKINRYITFTYQKKVFFIDLMIFLISFLIIPFSDLWVFIFFLPFLKKHKRTKLKFTNRIIRHFALFLLIVIGCSFSLYFYFYYHYLIILLSFLPFWSTFFINYAIELLLSFKHIKTAKNKLKS